MAQGGGRLQDLDDLLAIARDMEGKTICVFADAAAWPVQSYITKFRAEFEEHIRSNQESRIQNPESESRMTPCPP
jgi:NADH-quinone oxidoreductase subunit F